MLFVLGVGSLVALKGCAFTVVMDSFPHLKIWHVSLATAIAGFLVGLFYITPVSQNDGLFISFSCTCPKDFLKCLISLSEDDKEHNDPFSRVANGSSPW